MKSSPNASVVVVKVSKPSLYKVVRVEKKELMIVFENSRFLRAFRFNDIRDELIYKVEPARKPNNVICLNITFDERVTHVTHRFDEKNLNLIIAIEKKKDFEEQKSPDAEEVIEKKEDYFEPQKILSYTEEETIEDNYLPVDKVFLSRLLTVTNNNGKADTELFTDAAKACKKDQWREAVTILSRFVEKYPESKYNEKTLFLLAECYRRLYSDHSVEHFKECVKHYQNAIQKYPNSVYVPAATLMLANSYFIMNNYYEALGYYNILWSQHKDSEVAPEARFQVGRVYFLINKPEKAISAFQSVGKKYPGTLFAKKAKIEMAKALFEMNRFKKSLALLAKISETSPVNVYKYQDLLVYIGNNYYQLGQYKNARDTLLNAINLHPDIESNHLVLARIADTYHKLGAKKSAYKFYNLAIKKYPESDGALISSVRLASEYKKKDKEAILITPPLFFDGSEYHLYSNHHELYENIIKKHSNNPIWRFVMLRAAFLQQKDGEYEAGINTIKKILKKYPLTTSETSILHDSYEGFFKQKLDEQDYITVVNCYELDKDILEYSEVPNIFLMVGKAYRTLHLYNSAFSMFQTANKFFLEENRPSGLLIGLGESAFRIRDWETAYGSFMDLVQRYSDHKNITFAYYRLGQISLETKKYNKAKRFLNRALSGSHEEVPRIDVIAGIAKALKGMGQHKHAVRWFKDAVALLTKQRSFEDLYNAYLELGDLYIKIGDNINASIILEKALKLKKKDVEAEAAGVMFRLAECYHRLNKTEDALDLFRKIAAFQDSLWGRMAKARIKEIDIREEIARLKKLKT